jgi:hypothetical protein
MIDFALLDRLYSTAKNKADGKPMDSMRSLHGSFKRGSGMRNCRLFQTGGGYRVELHGNTIAFIHRKPDGYALVSIHNVEEWPTNTTSERIASILGINVWKHDNRLRANFSNCTHQKNGRSFRTYPPLVNGQEFMVGPDGVWCVNAEVVKVETDYVDREAAKPYLDYLKRLKQIGVPLCKLEGITREEITAHGGGNRTWNELTAMPEPSAEVVTKLIAAHHRSLFVWQPATSNLLVSSFTTALDALKRRLYAQNKVVKTERTHHPESFSGVPDHVRSCM